MVQMGEHHSNAVIKKWYTIIIRNEMYLPLLSFVCIIWLPENTKICRGFTRDVYNHFSSSPKRVAEFSKYQSFCEVKIHQILHPSQTRWLSVHSVVVRIVEQYSPLQLFFTDADGDDEMTSWQQKIFWRSWVILQQNYFYNFWNLFHDSSIILIKKCNRNI